VSDDYCLVMTSVETGQPADDLAIALVEQRLAACVQRIPLHSTYRWHDRVERSREELLLVKTTQQRSTDVIAWIEQHHPYELPELTVVPVSSASPSYLAWIAASVG
jgi:periplasmic divalent cation tolerance protein